MLDFHKLKPIVNDKYSFVGIDRYDSQLRFCLPKGFYPNNFITYNSKKDLFFLLYKVLEKFKNVCDSKQHLQKSNDRDGVNKSKGGIQDIRLPNTEIEENNIFYSKLNFINDILDIYDELKILSLVSKLKTNNENKFNKIHLFLHKGIYLDNGGIYIDEMTLPKQNIQYKSTDIVAMYCYIFYEIKQQLKEEIKDEVQTLAEDFCHRYLGEEYGLFNENYCNLTVDILKEVLEFIDHNTHLKDDDYWQFFSSVELFLYGNILADSQGEVWGIKNFYSVWESMCLTHISRTINSEYILYIDNKFLENEIIYQASLKPKKINIDNVFTINNQLLKPDVVIYSSPFANLSKINSFNLYMLDWDDYSYKTAFGSNLDYFKNYYRKKPRTQFKIAYEGQMRDGKHTFLELENFYKKYNDELIIDCQLPVGFYSYWDIDLLNTIDEQVLGLMQNLNHIFYVALVEFGANDSSSFYKFLIDKFDIDNSFFNIYKKYNPFKDSLLRCCEFTSPEQINISPNLEEEIVLKFSKFVEKIQFYLQIIDIKYLTVDYMLDKNNLNDLKERSVRKQFVYEYLLQKKLSKDIKFNNLNIKSDFWLPFWGASHEVIEVVPEYLNGYIDLHKINFLAIVDNYIK
ncbi:hypothetical protein [Nostoc sp. FACHB-145]|uniref:hypothetical protein n=1 Tax=Nostoc sp. FACHB-145 TaxID=2692836 RepID=UPI00168770FD|nr:hypothetical protein [Nostoc sp. FACHB-145]MBD2472669.1 hypothetical protein [Nostoc sp. FACHB-145]